MLPFCRIIADNGSKPMTVYLIHSISLLMSAVQVFCGGKMAVVAHLVGLEQLGYETDLGLTTAVRTTICSLECARAY